MASLMRQCGANIVTRDQLEHIRTPAPSGKHYPIPHQLLVDSLVRYINDAGLPIASQEYAVSHDGARFFGLINLLPGSPSDPVKQWCTSVGVRNSHDKTFAAQLVLGSHVMVCDNLMFTGEFLLSRKHTRHITRDVHAFMGRAFGALIDARLEQDDLFESYRRTQPNIRDVDHIIVDSVRRRVIPPSKLPKVLQEWETPSHDEHLDDDGNRTMWTLMNAFTETFKNVGNVHDLPRRTQTLNAILAPYAS